jgi:hypothetical protein
VSLVEDARKLDRLRGVDCVFCRTTFLETHPEWCPVPRIPRIVAALEAAERVVCMPTDNSDIEADEAIDALGAALLFSEVPA